MRDCFFLVADTMMAQSLIGFLSRDCFHRSVRCRAFDCAPERDVQVAVGLNDPGLHERAAELLRPRVGKYQHVVVMLDAEWDGAPSAAEQRDKIERDLRLVGWEEGSAIAVVIQPEVDAWLWTGTDHTARSLSWPSWPELEGFLVDEGLLERGQAKPRRPKEAAISASRARGKPYSASMHRDLAGACSIGRCTEPGLLYLVETLRRWFPEGDEVHEDDDSGGHAGPVSVSVSGLLTIGGVARDPR